MANKKCVINIIYDIINEDYLFDDQSKYKEALDKIKELLGDDEVSDIPHSLEIEDNITTLLLNQSMEWADEDEEYYLESGEDEEPFEDITLSTPECDKLYLEITTILDKLGAVTAEVDDE